MIEDKLLIWKFKSGNRDALARIYEKYKNNLLRMASGLLSRKSADYLEKAFKNWSNKKREIK